MGCVARPHIDNDETVQMKLFTLLLTPKRATQFSSKLYSNAFSLVKLEWHCVAK